MATPEQMAALEADLEGMEVLLLEPREFYDPFIIGTGEKGHDTFVLYDKRAMIEAMAADMAQTDEDDDYDPETAALEHFDFNMNQGGDGKPVYVEFLEEEATSPRPDVTFGHSSATSAWTLIDVD